MSQGGAGLAGGGLRPSEKIIIIFNSRICSVARGCPRMVWGYDWCILSAICVRLGAFGRDFGSISLRNRVWAGFRGGHLGAKMVFLGDFFENFSDDLGMPQNGLGMRLVHFERDLRSFGCVRARSWLHFLKKSCVGRISGCPFGSQNGVSFSKHPGPQTSITVRWVIGTVSYRPIFRYIDISNIDTGV